MKEVLECRERLSGLGSKALSNFELLNILICDINKSRAIAKHEEFYGCLPRCESLEEIREFYNLTKPQASKLMAALEIGKRIARASSLQRARIESPQDSYEYLKHSLRYLSKERFLILLLNSKNWVIKEIEIATGTINGVCISPREVFAPAIVNHALQIVIAHNHPTGDPAPSKEDISLTRTLKATGEMVGIYVIDHIIVGDDRYYSFKEEGRL